MKPAQKESGDKDSQPSASENAPDTLVSATTGMESEEVGQDQGKKELLELSTSDVNPTMSEVTVPVIDSGCTEESEVAPTTDPNDSLRDIGEDFWDFGTSETIETEKEIMSEESQSFASESVPCKNEIRSADNISSRSADNGIKVPCNESKNSKEETVSKREKQEDVREISAKRKNLISKEETVSKQEKQENVREISVKERKKKDQSCQVTCVPDNARSDEVKILKDKLAISKKDTETMQKLLDDVRKDYEELQKSFEKRESEIKNKAFVEELIKENDEMKKEKAELKRKTSKKEGRVSSASDESRSSERRKTAKDKSSFNSSGRGESGEMTCSCFVQSIRKVITDVTEDFKDMISLMKQSSAEQRESIEKELVKLKDEHMCAMERKDSEIRVFEEIIKGLQSRIRESEREVVSFRDAVSSAYEKKHKLYDDIRGLKDDLAKAQHDSKTSREDLERIKYGLKKFCTAEEYEELQSLNFKFRESREVGETQARQGESNADVTELRNKVTKFYPVLKKAKKDIAKLEEEKQEVENRLQAKISQATEKEKYLNKKLHKALNELKQSESELTELTKQLNAQTLQNTKLNASIKELERLTEDLRGKHDQELRTVNDKLKISNDRLRLCQEKYKELQEDYKTLRDGHHKLKTFMDDINDKKMKEVLNDSSDDDDSPEQLLKGGSLLKKQLEAEKEKNEKFHKEIELLRKDVDLWKEIAGDERYTGSAGYMQIENVDLKEEIRDHEAVIKQLISKKKEHVRIIKKLRAENTFLKASEQAPLNKSADELGIFLLDSGDELESKEPGHDRTSTQEHRVRFDKNGKMDNTEQSGCSDEEDDSLFVQFLDDNNDTHKNLYLAEILQYDTSVSEKE